MLRMVGHSNKSGCTSYCFHQLFQYCTFTTLLFNSQDSTSYDKLSNHLSTPQLAQRSVAIMTTTNGTYMFCDTDGSFSLKLTCAGQSCSSILGHSNLTCTQSDSKAWQCNNGVACSGTAGFSSSFSIAQSNETVLQTQKVSLNGTSFIFVQGGTGNATVVNGTTSSVATSSVAGSSTAVANTAAATSTTTAANSGSPTPSSSKSESAYSQHSYSASLLLIMLMIGLFLPQSQAVLTGAGIGKAVENIFNLFIDSLSTVHIGAEAIAGKFDQVITTACGAAVSNGVGSLAGLGAAFGQCEEAMVGFEMSLIGSSLGLTLRTYAGLGGVLLEGLTAAGEATVLTADAGAIPEIFIVNSALCGLLVSVIEQGLLEGSTESLCAAVESAAASINAGNPSPAASSSSTPSTVVSVSTPPPSSSTRSSSSSSPSPAPSSPTPGSPIPDVSNDACAACELSLYFIGVQGLAAKCNVAVPLGVGYDMSVLLCDSTLNGRYATFCSYLCANQCVTYDIQKWIQSAGSQFWSNATLPLCNQECPGFTGDGRCQVADNCPCAEGAKTCQAC